MHSEHYVITDLPDTAESNGRHRVSTALVTVIAGAAIAGTIHWGPALFNRDAAAAKIAAEDGCTGIGHEQAIRGDTWDSLAAELSDKYHYSISAARLKVTNNATLDSKSDNTANKFLQDDCLDVPGPIVLGEMEADGKETAGQYATKNGITLSVLRSKNPAIASATYVPPAGSVLEVGLGKAPELADGTKAYNTSFVLQPLPDSINNLYHADQNLRNKVILANAAFLGSSTPLAIGSPAYLPYTSPSAFMVKNHWSNSAVIDAYLPNYQQPNSQQAILPPQANTPARTATYALNAKQKALIEGQGMSRNNVRFLEEIIPAVESRIKAGDHMNPEIVIEQSIDEASLHGQFGAALPGARDHNVFGMKAVGSCDPRKYSSVYDCVLTSEYINGQWIQEYSGFWKFPSYEVMIDRYALQIGNLPFYRDAMHCAATPRGYAEGLEYKLNSACKIIGNEPAYATSPTYVSTLLNIGKAYKIPQILAAGEHVPIQPYNG